jgi:hypothetical protein
MSHYTIDYKGLTREQAITKAVEDIKEYLGPRTWAKLEEMFPGGAKIRRRDFRKWINSIHFAMMFVGVRGFPVYAYKRYFFYRAEVVEG